MQLSEKDKQALQEKYKVQRQAMWSGKQSTSQDSEEKTTEADQPVESSGDTAGNTTDSTDTTSSDPQSDSSLITVDQPPSTETKDEETNQDGSSVQSESAAAGGAPASSSTQNTVDVEKTSQSPTGIEASTPPTEATPIARNTGKEEEGGTTGGERVFWEALEQEGGPNILTWKLALAVIGLAIVLVGVGVWLGFLFAG